jgi:hypothetical protein
MIVPKELLKNYFTQGSRDIPLQSESAVNDWIISRHLDGYGETDFSVFSQVAQEVETGLIAGGYDVQTQAEDAVTYFSVMW